MAADLEMGLVPPQNTDMFDENSNISSDSLRPNSSRLPYSHSDTMIEQKSSGGKQRDKRSRRVRREAEAWKGHAQERIKLVQKGYQILAIICIFLAGVQASILAMTFTQTDITAQIVNGFFFAGLVADIGAATLSAASQRWFEMIRPEEAEHVYDYLNEPHSESMDSSFFQTLKNVVASPFATWRRYCSIELWVSLALKAPLKAAILGFAFMVAGVMLWVWSHEALVAKVLCTVLCVLLVILLPPFSLQHDRKETLRLFRLRRGKL